MTADKQELKARMMAEAEAAIDKLLIGAKEKEALQLSDIERLVRTTGDRVMERLTSCMVEEEAQRSESCVCPECGRKMRYKGEKARDLVTETGGVRLKRAYYYCPTCRKGFFPPGPPVGTE